MIHSFLLIGQSNMAGRGELSDAPTIDTSSIRVLKNGRWQPTFRPVNPDRSFAGFNLAESFAERYAKKYGVAVGLIPCADGGTCLDEWAEGGLLYEHAVGQARLAQRTSTLVGVLWHQGETDSIRPERIASYSAKLHAFVQALRRDLTLDGVPFLMGGLGDFLDDCRFNGDTYEYDKINRILEQTASELPATGFVSAKGLTGKPDCLHFDSKGLYEFGLRYFAAYEAITGGIPLSDEEKEQTHYGALNDL